MTTQDIERRIAALERQLAFLNTLDRVDRGSSVEDFTDLGDVPASYIGQGGKLVAVNSGATALEFKNLALDDLSDVAISSPAAGNLLRHNGTNWVNLSYEGTSFPAGASSGREFLRTDRLKRYVYDGANWREQGSFQYSLAGVYAVQPISAALALNGGGMSSSFQLFILSVDGHLFVDAGTWDASNNYEIVLYYLNSADALVQLKRWTRANDGWTSANDHYKFTWTSANTSVPLSAQAMQVHIVKNGNPPLIYVDMGINCTFLG